MIPGLQSSDLDVARGDKFGHTALQYAIRREHSEVVKILAKAGGTSNNAPDRHGQTLLHYAIWNRSLEAVEALLTTDIDVNAQDKSGYTGVFLASALRPRPEILKVLLEHGANPDLPLQSPPLYEIVSCGATGSNSIECFNLLLAANANINVQVGTFRWTPLHEAAAHRQKEYLKLLLDAKADISLRDQWGRTAIELAIAIDYGIAVTLILETKPDLNVWGPEGCTYLHFAVVHRSIESMKLLLEAGADVNARDKDGWTPLHYVAGKDLEQREWQSRREILQVLLKANADVNAETKEGMNALTLALEREDVNLDAEVINLLLEGLGDSEKGGLCGNLEDFWLPK